MMEWVFWTYPQKTPMFLQHTYKENFTFMIFHLMQYGMY